MLWIETKCGKISIKSLYKALKSGPSTFFLSIVIWNSCVQPKESFFGWEATWGKALTLDQLQKRGWPLANKCYLFQMHEESIDHILLHCAKTRTLWALFFTLFGVQWVPSASVKMTFLGCLLWEKRERKFGEQTLYVFFGLLGRLRNKIVFEEVVLSIQRL